MYCAKNSLTSEDYVTKNENLNLADLDLNQLKLSEEDALALSYLTPGLSKRIQKQLLSQLAPVEVRKLHRTLSAPTSEGQQKKELKLLLESTLPRRRIIENSRYNTKPDKLDKSLKMPRSFLPVKQEEYKPCYEFSVRSSSIGAEPKCDNPFMIPKPTITKSSSVREPRLHPVYQNDIHSPDSSISESLESSSRCLSDSSTSRPYSKYSDSSFSRYSPNRCASSNKTNLKKPSSSNNKKVSRFLRPDFFNSSKDDNIYLKEKKEREMETQKVLKEIRDKRKSRLRRERSSSREKQLENHQNGADFYKKNEKIVKEADKLLNNVCNSIKTLENNMKSVHDCVSLPVDAQYKNNVNSINHNETKPKVLHDYVNVKVDDQEKSVVEKKKVSKIARPKSYPTENMEKEKKVALDKESKLTKIRKGFNRQSREKSKEDKNEENKTINEEEKGHKNKLLQSIEKKLEKFRSTGNITKDPREVTATLEKKTSVENTIKRLREQSLPRNLEQCTESGLIKRAVSVEDLSGSKPLQASRKSVTKILGLFKKYEEQDGKRKVIKKPKNNENGEFLKVESENNDSNENIEADRLNSNLYEPSFNEAHQSEKNDTKKRPRSLLLDKVKHFQNTYNGAKSDTVLDNKDSKVKSKLPLNSFRRSLNLESLPGQLKFYKNPNNRNVENDKQTERTNLRLDLHRDESELKPSNRQVPSSKENQNSLTNTDDSSTMLSPSEDYMSCDSWSVSSDCHHGNDLQSPLSPNGHLYPGDENESVIDRIKRKSFYTRFNEKKRTRRPISSYKDLDLGYKMPTDYSSLDYKGYEYRNPVTRKTSYASLLQEPAKNCRSYSMNASLMNDYVNVPNRYQMYSSKIDRPSSSLYSDAEDNSLDDLLSNVKSKKYAHKFNHPE